VLAKGNAMGEAESLGEEELPGAHQVVVVGGRQVDHVPTRELVGAGEGDAEQSQQAQNELDGHFLFSCYYLIN